MAVSRPDRCGIAALLLLCLPLATPAAAPATDIQLDAATSQIDYGANRLTFTDVTISQGELRIRADRAVANGTGLRFDDSRWEFTGNVRIGFGNGTLTASDASVRFAGNRMAVAQARGTPAQFELYDIREQVARSETRPGSSDRVQITIRPEAGDTSPPPRPVERR